MQFNKKPNFVIKPRGFIEIDLTTLDEKNNSITKSIKISKGTSVRNQAPSFYDNELLDAIRKLKINMQMRMPNS